MSDEDGQLPKGDPLPPTVEVDRDLLRRALLLIKSPDRKGSAAPEIRKATIREIEDALRDKRLRAGWQTTPGASHDQKGEQ